MKACLAVFVLIVFVVLVPSRAQAGEVRGKVVSVVGGGPRGQLTLNAAELKEASTVLANDLSARCRRCRAFPPRKTTTFSPRYRSWARRRVKSAFTLMTCWCACLSIPYRE